MNSDRPTRVLSELLQNQTNHLTKFWGVEMWLYLDGYSQLVGYMLKQIEELLSLAEDRKSSSKSNLAATVRCMMTILNWRSWHSECKIESVYSFVWVARLM